MYCQLVIITKSAPTGSSGPFIIFKRFILLISFNSVCLLSVHCSSELVLIGDFQPFIKGFLLTMCITIKGIAHPVYCYCCSKPVYISLFNRTQKKIFSKMYITKWFLLPLTFTVCKRESCWDISRNIFFYVP